MQEKPRKSVQTPEIILSLNHVHAVMTLHDENKTCLNSKRYHVKRSLQSNKDEMKAGSENRKS